MEHLQAKVGLKCVPELPLGQVCFVKRDWSQSEWLSHGWSKGFSGRPPLPHHLKINNIVLYGWDRAGIIRKYITSLLPCLQNVVSCRKFGPMVYIEQLTLKIQERLRHCLNDLRDSMSVTILFVLWICFSRNQNYKTHHTKPMSQRIFSVNLGLKKKKGRRSS